MIELDFAKGGGLVPAVAQDLRTGEVLMLAYMDEAAWRETLAGGMAVYFSRDRKARWKKGESSGNIQLVREIRIDCDADAVLLKVEQVGGAACHTGHAGCFFRIVSPDGSVTETGEILFDPAKVYHK